MPYRLTNDFVEGAFRILASSNVNGRCIPRQAAMQRFYPRESEATNLLRSYISFETTNLTMATGEITPPTPRQIMDLRDIRVRDVEPPKTDRVDSISNIVSLATAKAEDQPMPGTPPKAETNGGTISRKLPVFILIALVVNLGAVIMVRALQSKRKQGGTK